MDNLLILNNDSYKEYPLEDFLDLGKHQIFRKHDRVYVKTENGSEEILPGRIQQFIGTALLYLREGKRTYLRKQRFHIRDHTGELRIKGFEGSVFIEENNMHVRAGEQFLYINDCRMTGTEYQLIEGDSILINTIRLTFMGDRIEIEGNEEDYDSSLLQTEDMDAFFEGFPHYCKTVTNR